MTSATQICLANSTSNRVLLIFVGPTIEVKGALYSLFDQSSAHDRRRAKVGLTHIRHGNQPYRHPSPDQLICTESQSGDFSLAVSLEVSKENEFFDLFGMSFLIETGLSIEAANTAP
ncbi:hypothetical protein MJO29_012199 [Puccinia striiformis f. sp. tritici]|uniref:hypothetical protein n=1 Tax=Puccinia striiformis f. sp. tritici TaxID=168172 RepID=UPI000A125BB5|nr:hypothetical protein Pst134EA_022885 [Puccinia striiformis f. sp. tritici]KAH9445924.1 hypothetical protein Pst134EB_023749 [Puccinia striiformis f. sp. tritici]KAH9455420.1 hypothetical protein Pst134EA_022885 [Puccinia striiformis f. sp. tritici]KAI7945811.1 hypothetical protein MJO29_012199 [Puccinia striiformis f. sp. tritici]KAI9611844.1 hypothetical protein KEM48_004351 [Puccinia striiformis f. sp. tritici PST-130]